ncbi:MAG: VanW family protein [Eubacteriales bacterium]
MFDRDTNNNYIDNQNTDQNLPTEVNYDYSGGLPAASGYAPHAGKPRKKIMLRIMMFCLIIIGSLAGIYLYSFFQNEKYLEVIDTDTFYSGIYIDNIHVGGLTKKQALDAISSQQKASESEIQVEVVWDEDEKYIFTGKDVIITYNTDEIIDEAFLMGRVGTNAERYNRVMGFTEQNVRLNTSREIDPSPIEADVKNIAISKEADVSEPAVEFHPDPSKPQEEWFVYSDFSVGITTDADALWKSVQSAFIDQEFESVQVPKWEVHPDEKIDFRAITQEIVSFSTRQARNANREHNIALACSMINGTVLMPGEEFSMNDTTGKRTAAAGFKEANAIVGGNELVPDIAGGVCQVSGTLYNAALLADLEITERHHHSFVVSYLTRGRDATVNYGTADLKFKNNRDYPIYIVMYTEGRDVYAKIFGAPLTNCDHIEIKVKTINTIAIGDPKYVKDAEVPVGSKPVLIEGRQGITCEVYKVYKDKDGATISTEFLYTDVYKHYYPELHVNPADYEGYINPTPTPTPEPSDTVSPTEAATPTDSPAPTSVG